MLHVNNLLIDRMDSKEILRELQPKTCELELELIQSHMTQKPMLRGEHARELWPFKDGLCRDLDGKASLIVARRAPLSLPYWRWFSFLPLRGDREKGYWAFAECSSLSGTQGRSDNSILRYRRVLA